MVILAHLFSRLLILFKYKLLGDQAVKHWCHPVLGLEGNESLAGILTAFCSAHLRDRKAEIVWPLSSWIAG